MAGEVTLFDDVELGEELGPIEIHMVRDRIVKYAKVAGLNAPRFTNDEGAQKEGFKGAIVPGSYSMSILSKMLVDRFGVDTITKMGVNFRGLIYHGDRVICRGIVTNKQDHGDGGILECDVLLESLEGDMLLKGQAVISLPSKA